MTALRAWLRHLAVAGPIIVRRRGTYVADLARAYQAGHDRGQGRR